MPGDSARAVPPAAVIRANSVTQPGKKTPRRGAGREKSETGRPPVRSHASGAVEPDLHLSVRHDHGHSPRAVRVFEHLLELPGVLLHVEVRDLALLAVFLTGGSGVGSAFFAVDGDGHVASPKNWNRR